MRHKNIIVIRMLGTVNRQPIISGSTAQSKKKYWSDGSYSLEL